MEDCADPVNLVPAVPGNLCAEPECEQDGAHTAVAIHDVQKCAHLATRNMPKMVADCNTQSWQVLGLLRWTRRTQSNLAETPEEIPSTGA